ncbi:MAG: glycoside hydrolase family 95 protein, partial [Faecalibacterium sp.]
MQYMLKENTPAKEISDAYLLGNGRLGAAVFGNVPIEKIRINDDTLTSGYERRYQKEDYYEHLQVARKLTLEGKCQEANAYMDKHMYGAWCQSYLPLATLCFSIGMGSNARNGETKRLFHMLPEEVHEYERTLQLDEAVTYLQYERDGIHYTREAFVSHGAQVLAVKLTADHNNLTFALSLDSTLQSYIEVENDMVSVLGRAPDNVEPQYTQIQPGVVYQKEGKNPTLRFASKAMISQTDGEVTSDDTRVYVNNASYAVVLLAAGTNYAGYKVPRGDSAEDVLAFQGKLLELAAQMPYDELKAAHIKEYQELYHRVDLVIGEGVTDHLPTSKRLEVSVKSVQDPSLAALQLHFVRYLLISSSRPGTQPSNLQGIWNERVQPAWSCNLTTNINAQMNYWPAEVLGLSECHTPLLDYIFDMADHGAQTAKDFFHAPGWVTNHNMDLWRHSVPVCETTNFAYFIFGGVWMCQHLWTHYQYTLDKEFLAKIYPVLHGASEFILSQLVENNNGYLVTAPSTSPENRYLAPGTKTYRDLTDKMDVESRFAGAQESVVSICAGSTIDMALTQELFGNLKTAADILHIEDDFLLKTEAAKARLLPFQIGEKNGQLQEWNEDYEECCPAMMHVSHLYTIFPADVINQYDTPELFEAAKKSVHRRFMHGGFRYWWGGGWGLCLAARCGMTDIAEIICRETNKKYSTCLVTQGFTSLVDAISGHAAGIA